MAAPEAAGPASPNLIRSVRDRSLGISQTRSRRPVSQTTSPLVANETPDLKREKDGRIPVETVRRVGILDSASDITKQMKMLAQVVDHTRTQ